MGHKLKSRNILSHERTKLHWQVLWQLQEPLLVWVLDMSFLLSSLLIFMWMRLTATTASMMCRTSPQEISVRSNINFSSWSPFQLQYLFWISLEWSLFMIVTRNKPLTRRSEGEVQLSPKWSETQFRLRCQFVRKTLQLNRLSFHLNEECPKKTKLKLSNSKIISNQ